MKEPYRGTSLIRDRPALAPYSRFMPRALWWSQGGWQSFMREVPLYSNVWGVRLHQQLRTSQCEMLLYRSTSLIRKRLPLQGYLAHKKTHLPLGPYGRTVPRALWWSQGGSAFSYERGTPA